MQVSEAHTKVRYVRKFQFKNGQNSGPCYQQKKRITLQEIYMNIGQIFAEDSSSHANVKK